MAISDKSTLQQIFGSLMKKPSLLGEVDKYKLSVLDFPNKFYKIIFTAIEGLYKQQVKKIEPIDIDNFLETNPPSKHIFQTQNGIEYLQDVCEFAEEDNFQYYYTRLKKLNLLRDLQKQGIDTSSVYEEDLTKEDASKINGHFEELTTQDICDTFKRVILKLESEYAKSANVETFDLSEGIDEFIQIAQENVSIGLPLQGAMQTKVLSGAQLGTLTIRSAPSGVSKTRLAVGDACKLAFPISYNSYTGKWERSGSCEKVLFIMTEQTYDQIRYMILAYLTDINESRFKYNQFTEKERKRIHIAAELIKKFRNLIIMRIPDPTITQLKTIVREHCLINDVSYVFFDYIFISPGLLNEFRHSNLRNDELLLLMATALKDLAVELNIAVFTSTQVNAQADDNTNIRNESSLAGGRATINKADNGMIITRPTRQELETLQPVTDKFGIPSLVFDVYKVRSGQWTQLRIWTIANLGTLKFRDLFVTDARLEVIPDFEREPDIEMQDWADGELNELIHYVEQLNQHD